MLDLITHTLIAANRTIEQLTENIEEYVKMANAHGEMAESARLAAVDRTPWYNGSEEDYENEEEEYKQLAKLYAQVRDIKTRLELSGYEIVPNTLQIWYPEFFACGIKKDNTYLGLYIYHNGQIICELTSSDYHSLRRYMENHADDF